MPSLRRSIACALGVLLAACSYYDSSLLAADGSTGGAGGTDAGGAAGATAGASGAAGGAGAAGAGAGAAGAAGATGGASGAAGGGGVGGDGYGPEFIIDNGLAHAVTPPTTVPDKKDGPAFSLVLRSVDFGENGKSYEKNGLDLDNKYTKGPTDNQSCKAAPSAPASNSTDFEYGRDNAFGNILNGLALVSDDFKSSKFSEGLAEGSSTIMLEVLDYNGERNDDDVTIVWLVTNKLPGKDPPKFDGTDVWPIQDISYLDADPAKPRYVAEHAYVTDGVLVASLPGNRIESKSFSLVLTSPLLVATLRAPDASNDLWRIESGTLVGRWPLSNMLEQLGRFKAPFSSDYICPGTNAFTTIKKTLCESADIAADASQQNQVNLPCDAVSVALRFQAIQAQKGDLSTSEIEPSQCATAPTSEDLTCE